MDSRYIYRLVADPRKLYRRLRELRVYSYKEIHLLQEKDLLKKTLKFLDCDCVFDVGANKGQYADFLRRRVGFQGYILSFEPLPDMAALLRERAESDPKWLIFQLALDETSGEANFNIMKSNVFSSLGTPKEDEIDQLKKFNAIETSIIVKKETLNGVFPALQAEFGFRRPFLKMDTQGFDVRVVKGASEVISRFLGLQSELSFKRLYDGSPNYREAIDFYEGCGFELSGLFPNTPGHFPYLIEMDCIMINRSVLTNHVVNDAQDSFPKV